MKKSIMAECGHRERVEKIEDGECRDCRGVERLERVQTSRRRSRPFDEAADLRAAASRHRIITNSTGNLEGGQ